MISIKRNFFAYLDEMRVITILLPFSYHNGHSSLFFVSNDDQKYPLNINEKIILEDSIKYVCHLPMTLSFGLTNWIVDEYGGKTDLQIGAVIRTVEFDQFFFYDGQDLGVVYYYDHSQFKIWAPTATMVRIKLSPPDGKLETLDMNRSDKGIWTLKKNGNLDGFRYTFLVCVNLRWQEVIDPYAVAVTVNGEKGVIVNLEKTRVPKPILPSFDHPVDAIIYETHIRDFTIHPNSGVTHKGKYIGASEIGTSSPETGTTGLSYLKELGITHIEFLPLHDFEGVNEIGDFSEYNWGYNPVHFNVPEGSFATNPTDPYSRICELKKMIRTIQEQGIRVIFDVVYNHVYDRESSSFEKIVPGYFFRHDEFGMPSDGTGVGNDIASERLMVRKFILDSVKFWIEEYGIDGLRFDLMGILDIETMNKVRALVDQIDSSLIIIGEGWDLNTPLSLDKKAIIKNQAKLTRIGQFNDQFRDTIKGSSFNLYDRGFVFGNLEKLAQTKLAITGSISSENGLFLEPGQSVNYLESHDNHTIWDKFFIMLNGENEDLIKNYQRLATTILLLSQGIPFLHSGQEFFRTKNGVGNSYSSPDEVNRLDWVRKQKYMDDILFVKGLIELRKSHQAFRLRRADQIRTHLEWLSLSEPLLAYRLKDIKSFGEWTELVVIFNPLNSSQLINLPLSGQWHVLVNHEKAGSSSIKQLDLNQIVVESISALVIGRMD